MTNQEEKKDVRELVYGNTTTFKLPSGYEMTIREQNGNDDDILTNKALATDLSNLDAFIAAIVVKTDLPFNLNGKLTLEGTKKLPLRDKYFILIKTRVFSIGETLQFPYHWEDSEQPDTYSEDLTQYLWDYNEPLPQVGEEGYFSERIEPYKLDALEPIKIVTPSGKTLSFNVLNNAGEKYLLNLPKEQQTKNSNLKARNLNLKTEVGWEKVEHFGMFSRADMEYIRKKVKEYDPEIMLLTEVTNPRETTIKNSFPILQLGGFFFPEEI